MTVKTSFVRDEGGVFTPANDEVIVSAAKAHLSRHIRRERHSQALRSFAIIWQCLLGRASVSISVWRYWMRDTG
jgi:hypothetical protein